LLLHLDESAGAATFVDSSGNGNDGSCSGAGCPTAGVPGAIHTAALFGQSGADHVIDVAGNRLLNPTGTAALGAFVKPTGLDCMADVISVGDSLVLRVLPDGSVVTFFYFSSTAYTQAKSQGINVIDARFHHLFGQKTASTIELYVDGVLSATATAAASIVYPFGSDVWIGHHHGLRSPYDFRGVIDEVRLYDRSLAATEILELAEAGNVRAGTRPDGGP
jgi:hypothetical protein